MIFWHSIIVFLSYLLVFSSAHDLLAGRKVISVRSLNQSWSNLPKSIDWWFETKHAVGEVPASDWPALKYELTNSAFTFEIRTEDMRAEANALAAGRTKIPYSGLSMLKNDDFYRYFRNMSEITDLMSLLERYPPTGVSVTPISFGETWEKRKIMGLKVTSTNGPSEKPIIVYHGGQHAGEWIGPMVVTYILQHLIEDYGEDQVVKEVMDAFEWHLVPVLNVDGFEFSWTEDRWSNWRKTRSMHPENAEAKGKCELDNPPDQCEICTGVDPNRNWAFHWGGEGQRSEVCSGNYLGPSAFSEKENKAVADYIESFKGQVKGYIDFHCCGQMWMSPWGYTGDYPDDYDEMTKVGQEVVAAILRVDGKTYREGSVYHVIYPASGCSNDHVYGELGVIFSYGVELRSGSSAQILPNGQEVFAGILKMGQNLKSRI